MGGKIYPLWVFEKLLKFLLTKKATKEKYLKINKISLKNLTKNFYFVFFFKKNGITCVEKSFEVSWRESL
jgi:hypothetical protein